MKIFTLFRTYHRDATMGELFVDNEFFCFTLEGPKQPLGVKVPGRTAIPEGAYDLRVTPSPRFGRDLVLVTSQGLPRVERDGVSFEGIRFHKGNTVADTEGCILVGDSSNFVDRIWDCSMADKVLIQIVKRFSGSSLVITSY